jgi:hypothetical protein
LGAVLPYFRSAQFTYGAEHDVYHCPNGEILPFRYTDTKNERKLYRARASICKACLLRPQGTANRQGRVIHRSFHADLLEHVRGYQGTPAFTKAMCKRQVWVEPLFAEAKQWHGLRRFRLRAIRNVNMEGVLIATGQNLKRYLAARGWGKRWGATGCLTSRSISRVGLLTAR